MLNFCMRGFSKACGLAILTFCLGVITGACLPAAWVAVLEMAMLLVLGYLCLFKW